MVIYSYWDYDDCYRPQYIPGSIIAPRDLRPSESYMFIPGIIPPGME